MRGVFLDFDTLGPADLDRRRLEASLAEWVFFGHTPPVQVVSRLAGADVVVANKVRLDGPTLRQIPTLRLVCLAATGTDNVDLDTATKLGVAVCNVRNYASQAVAQHTFGLIVALCNRLIAYHSAVRAGRWQKARSFVCSISLSVSWRA